MNTIPELMAFLTKTMHKCKEREQYKKAKVADKSRYLYSDIAMALAFNCTPIPSEADLIPRQYVITVVKPLCEELLSKINEMEIIDHKLILSMVEPLYMARYNLAHGKASLGDMYEIVHKSTMISKELKDYLSCED